MGLITRLKLYIRGYFNDEMFKRKSERTGNRDEAFKVIPRSKFGSTFPQRALLVLHKIKTHYQDFGLKT